MSSRQKGLLGVLASAFCFACMSCCVRLVGDLPTYEKLLFRNFFAIFISGFIFLREKPEMHFNKTGTAFLTLRLVAGALGMFCNFYAIDHINLSDAGMLNKMSPLFALIFSWILLGERLNWKQCLIVVGGFLGSLLIIKPTGSNLLLVPTVIAALGGMLAGVMFTSVRGATTNGVPKSFVVLAYSIFTTVVFTILSIPEFVMPTIKQFLVLLACATFGAGGQFGMTYAYSQAPAREITIYEFTQVIYSAILGYIFFGQLSDLYSFIGYAVIITMGVLNTRLSNKA